MTHHTDVEQERADFLAWLRIKPCGAAHDFAWEAWKAARRAPAVQTEITYEMSDAGLNAYNKCTSPFRRTKLAAAFNAMLAAAPHPTDAAPVQLPDPVAKIEGGSLKWHIPDSGYSLPVRYLQGTHKLYTEQQVRQLLAQHGIK